MMMDKEGGTRWRGDGKRKVPKGREMIKVVSMVAIRQRVQRPEERERNCPLVNKSFVFSFPPFHRREGGYLGRVSLSRHQIC